MPKAWVETAAGSDAVPLVHESVYTRF